MNVYITDLEGVKYKIAASSPTTLQNLKASIRHIDKFRDSAFNLYLNQNELANDEMIDLNDINDDNPLIIVRESELSDKTFSIISTFDFLEYPFSQYSYETIHYGKETKENDRNSRKIKNYIKTNLPNSDICKYDEYLGFVDPNLDESSPVIKNDDELNLPKFLVGDFAPPLIYRSPKKDKHKLFTAEEEIPPLQAALSIDNQIFSNRERPSVHNINANQNHQNQQTENQNDQNQNNNLNRNDVNQQQNQQHEINQDQNQNQVENANQNQNQNNVGEIGNQSPKRKNKYEKLIYEMTFLEFIERIKKINNDSEIDDIAIELIKYIYVIDITHRKALIDAIEQLISERITTKDSPILEILRTLQMLNDPNTQQEEISENISSTFEIDDLFADIPNSQPPKSKEVIEKPQNKEENEISDDLKEFVDDIVENAYFMEEEEETFEEKYNTVSGRVRRYKMLTQLNDKLLNSKQYDVCMIELNQNYTNSQRHDITNLMKVGFDQNLVLKQYDEYNRDYELTLKKLLSSIK